MNYSFYPHVLLLLLVFMFQRRLEYIRLLKSYIYFPPFSPWEIMLYVPGDLHAIFYYSLTTLCTVMPCWWFWILLSRCSLNIIFSSKFSCQLLSPPTHPDRLSLVSFTPQSFLIICLLISHTTYYYIYMPVLLPWALFKCVSQSLAEGLRRCRMWLIQEEWVHEQISSLIAWHHVCEQL